MPTCGGKDYSDLQEHCHIAPEECMADEDDDVTECEVDSPPYCHCQACGESEVTLCESGYCAACHPTFTQADLIEVGEGAIDVPSCPTCHGKGCARCGYKGVTPCPHQPGDPTCQCSVRQMHAADYQQSQKPTFDFDAYNGIRRRP